MTGAGPPARGLVVENWEETSARYSTVVASVHVNPVSADLEAKRLRATWGHQEGFQARVFRRQVRCEGLRLYVWAVVARHRA